MLLGSGVALSTSRDFFANSELRPVTPHLLAGNITNEQALLKSGRDVVSRPELTFAIAHNLLPPATKSLLTVSGQLKHGEYIWNEKGVPSGRVTIWVDLRRQLISVFRDGHEIGTAVIVFGAEGMSSPEGTFKILKKSADYHSRTYDAAMPYSLFITDNGVALHGSPISKRRASHGCIGLPVEFAKKLFEASVVGDLVEITKSGPNIPL